MLKPEDQLSATAKGYRSASRVISACLEMVVPCLAGYWLDAKFASSPWFLLVGLALGMWLGIKSLVRLASGQSSPETRPPSDKDKT
ncbi:AtpZ/AtpI family protein [Planctomycetota bacterium]